MKKIITYGTFDTLHYGHINLLRRAKALGDYLIVGLSTDEFNNIKGKKSVLNYDERKNILEAIKYVDEIIPEENWNQKPDDIKKYNVDILVMGDDWKDNENFKDLKKYCQVMFLERTKNISTTMIKGAMENEPK